MNCQEIKAVLHGFLDGELDPVHHLAVEQHLAECAACARSVQQRQSLEKAMATGTLYFEAPDSLEKRLRSAVRRAARTESAGWPHRWSWSWTRLLTPMAAAAVVLFIALPLALHTSTEDRIAQDIVSSHVRSLMANHLADVASTDQHTVKPWFNGKLPFSPPVSDLAAQGFPLTGGRLDYVDNHPVAALVYQHRKHFINLFIWPSRHTSNTGETQRTRQGYNTVHYSQNGMEFWVVSDLNQTELRGFARLVQEASAPTP